jgi:hypothetical protein
MKWEIKKIKENSSPESPCQEVEEALVQRVVARIRLISEEVCVPVAGNEREIAHHLLSGLYRPRVSAPGHVISVSQFLPLSGWIRVHFM